MDSDRHNDDTCQNYEGFEHSSGNPSSGLEASVLDSKVRRKERKNSGQVDEEKGSESNYHENHKPELRHVFFHSG